MKKAFRRFAAFALLLTMIVGLLPISAIAAPSKERAEDVWLAISELEDRAAAMRGVCSVEAREAAYTALVDQIIDLVENSDQYVPGSLERHGNFFFWLDENGDPNGYSPNLRAKQRQNAIPGADPAACAATKTVSFADRGGYPGSVDVAAIQPYIGIDSSFTDQYENECYSIAQATGGTGTSYQASNATITNIGQAIATCGVVIFDSHGTTDYSGSYSDYTSEANSSYLCLTNGTGITGEDKSAATGEFGTYYHAFKSGTIWCVDGTAIANHVPNDSPNGLLWMAICLSMATEGLHVPLREKGVEVAYGYSQSVSFTGDYAYEACFFGDLKQGETVFEGAAHMKQRVGIKDPYTNPPAYPIFVSSEDVYPGHGNVDKEQTVSSTWTLIGSDYEITAISNNEDWGTVSVQGVAITAVPNHGYFVDDCTLISGTAEVARNGNRFILNPSSDCTVQVNFAPKTPVTVTYVANGAVFDTAPGYAGDPLNLPNTAAAVEGWTFKGWVLDPIEESQEKPTFLKPGASFIPSADTTVYALYVRIDANGSGNVAFELLSEAPDDWEGNYVISYGTDSGMKLLKGLSGSASGSSIETSSNMTTMTQAGVTLEDNTLQDVPDSVIFTMEPRGDYYSLQSVSTEAYYGMSSYSLSAYSGYTAVTCDWTPGVGADASCLESATSSGYPYLSYNDSSYGNYFWCYSSINTNIRLWKETALGVKTYSTNPGNMVHTHSMQHYEAVQPTCGTDGNLSYYRCVICGKCFTDEAGENEIAQAATVLPATGNHEYGAWTANNDGTHKKTCSVCGGSQSEACAYGSTVNAPTCTEAGYTVFTCQVCDYSYRGADVEPLGHDWSEWTQTVDPTCTQQGEKKRTCGRCQAVDTQSVEALGHNYNDEVTAPTCTEAGYTTRTCSVCGDSQTVDETAPLGHGFSDWTVSVQPSCTDGGQEKRTCSRCNAEETRGIDPLGHVWDGGVVTKVPTDQEEGERLFTCERCGGTSTEAIEKLEHPNPFVDVAYGSYYFDAVQWAYYHDPRITGGTDATHFSPNAPCTREQIVFFLWAAAGKPAPGTTETVFADVKPTQYFYQAVLWAQEQGITSGVTATRFGVGNYCTREQAVTFLWRSAGSPEPAGRTSPFRDVPGNAYYAKAVRWAVENHITSGTGTDIFSPKLFCTRSQVVTFLYRHDLLLVR